MIKPNRWKMCVGTEEFGHEPNVYPPSKEDIYTTGQIVRCQCDPPLNKRDCPRHAEICTDCNTMRKNMISFDYLPIGEQLALLMRSSTHCIDFLTMWMNKDVLQSPNEIKDFWDGEKVRIYQAFWDPASMWEFPVICPSCKMAHKSFPRVCDEKIGMKQSRCTISVAGNVESTLQHQGSSTKVILVMLQWESTGMVFWHQNMVLEVVGLFQPLC